MCRHQKVCCIRKVSSPRIHAPKIDRWSSTEEGSLTDCDDGAVSHLTVRRSVGHIEIASESAHADELPQAQRSGCNHMEFFEIVSAQMLRAEVESSGYQTVTNRDRPARLRREEVCHDIVLQRAEHKEWRRSVGVFAKESWCSVQLAGRR